MNRILVAHEVHKKFSNILAELTNSMELGNGLDEGVQYGPVLNESVINRVEAHKNDALAKGGRLIAGGARSVLADHQKGYFYRPTNIDDAPLDSMPMCEETYGPLAAIAAFDTIGEAVEISNSLEYGLAAYIYGEDLERTWAIAERLEFGAVRVNVNHTRVETHSICLDPS